MDVNELDINGKNCLAIVYEELTASINSAPASGFVNLQMGLPLDLEPIRFLFQIGSDPDLRCID